MGVLRVVPGTRGNAQGMTDYFIGVDLGQDQDYSAIAGIERFWRRTYTRNPVTWQHDPQDEFQLTLRYLERIPLGTAYPAVVARAAKVSRGLAQKGRCALAVDATGVGAAVVDLFRGADVGAGTAFLPVSITDGDRARFSDGKYRVPKINLVAGLQAVLGREELAAAEDLREFTRLVEEMRGFGVKLSEGRNQVFGGKKDDLVIAVSLAVWAAGMSDLGEVNPWSETQS